MALKYVIKKCLSICIGLMTDTFFFVRVQHFKVNYSLTALPLGSNYMSMNWPITSRQIPCTSPMPIGAIYILILIHINF